MRERVVIVHVGGHLIGVAVEGVLLAHTEEKEGVLIMVRVLALIRGRGEALTMVGM